MNISIRGHAHTRVFAYTKNGIYHQFAVPGGAALLQSLLSGKPAALGDAYRREYAELQRFEDTKSGKSRYAIARRMGYAEGETDFASEIPESSTSFTLIWGSTGGSTGGSSFGDLALSGKDCPILWACSESLPDQEQFAQTAANCFLFIDADVLRKAGALISRQISWERSATELIWQLQNNPALSYMLKASYVLIAFAEDGAVYLHRENGEWEASLVLTHGGGEGSLRGKLPGALDDAFILMTASLAQQFPAVMSGEQPLRILPILKTAESLMTSCYTIEGLQNGDYTISAETEDEETAFLIPLTPGQNTVEQDTWCVSNNVNGKRIFDTAFEYVMEGAKAIDNLPQLSFGALTTVDRWEIEAYQNIRNLIVAYAADASVRPLSIAVFGSPGSGKSFGVTQIAKHVLPGKVEKLEFNVSQFTGLADLAAAFQKVRDAILEGKLPLVFFDEFDSDRDGLPLGWVKSFLMPMQDGTFKDESGEHPLGKCILVFAGGTAPSFAKFTAPMNISEQPADGQTQNSPQSDGGRNEGEKTPDSQQIQRMMEEHKHFKNVKGPDFVSRLKGTIDVLGPNQKDPNDNNYILRRALLLRSLCERKLDMKHGRAPISPNIIWAMLLVPNYKHGARSMEAILDMSRLEGNVWEPVSLPFYSQLSLHVDADAFIRLVLREVILNSFIESLAQTIHADFAKERFAEGNENHPNAVAWEALSEGFKESNRNVARRIGQKLSAFGYAYDAGDTPFPSIEEFDEATLLLLAQREHADYMNDKFAAGWTYGANRDNEKKTNPTLVDWDELSLEERQKDFDIAQNIIPLLKRIGLRVYKTF
jgi:hypothetical protein